MYSPVNYVGHADLMKEAVLLYKGKKHILLHQERLANSALLSSFYAIYSSINRIT